MKLHVIFLFGIFLQIHPSFQLRRYGVTCGCGEYCEETLVCSDFKCQCAKGLTYFPIWDRCYLKVGQNCSVDQDQCVKNSRCNENKICECNPPSKPLQNGACSGNYIDDCNANHKCTEGYFLECDLGIGKCTCSQNGVFENERCVSAIGAPCKESGTTHCQKHSECVDGRCRCLPGFKDGWTTCQREYGGSCGEGTECADNLKCRNGVCSCAYESQVWDGVDCRYKLGEICNRATQLDKICEDDNANCRPSPTTPSIKTCQCKGCWRQLNGVCVPPN